MRRLAPFLALVLAGPAFADAGDPVAGRDVFLSYCAVCHGMRATGDGPMADVLKARPADLTQLAASNGGVFPVLRVVRQVDGRDPMLAHGGEMPLYGELFRFPDGAISSETGQPIVTAQPIADVAAYLATIQE
jgi:mono/diheme cytochrome c family protein